MTFAAARLDAMERNGWTPTDVRELIAAYRARIAELELDVFASNEVGADLVARCERYERHLAEACRLLDTALPAIGRCSSWGLQANHLRNRIRAGEP